MQKRVREFVGRYNLSCGETARYLDLVSEVGELGKEILKGTDYGKRPFSAPAALKGEVGDCLFSLLALCGELELDAEEVLAEAMDKYARRFERKGDIGSGR